MEFALTNNKSCEKAEIKALALQWLGCCVRAVRIRWVRGIQVVIDLQRPAADRLDFSSDDERNQLAPLRDSGLGARRFRTTQRPDEVGCGFVVLDSVGCLHTGDGTAC
jgi:hypothetical protein